MGFVTTTGSASRRAGSCVIVGVYEGGKLGAGAAAIDDASGGVLKQHAKDGILTGTEFMTMVRNKAWKLVHFLDEPYGQLFDLQADPNEVHNLWLDPGSVEMKEELLAVLREWRIRSQYHTADWPAEWR